MSTLTLDDAITKSIASHAAWGARLRTVISNGATDLDARDIRREDQCDLAKWLHSLDEKTRRTARWRELRDFHARFHEAAARVIVLIDERRRAEALASMQPDGEFTLTSNDLLNAMKVWRGHAE